jgi:hypothetical protein
MGTTGLTLPELIVANLIMLSPVYILVGRGVWYVAQMFARVDQMWQWYESNVIVGGRRASDPQHTHTHR